MTDVVEITEGLVSKFSEAEMKRFVEKMKKFGLEIGDATHVREEAEAKEPARKVTLSWAGEDPRWYVVAVNAVKEKGELPINTFISYKGMRRSVSDGQVLLLGFKGKVFKRPSYVLLRTNIGALPFGITLPDGSGKLTVSDVEVLWKGNNLTVLNQTLLDLGVPDISL